MKWFKNKRLQIAKSLPKGSVLVLASAPEVLRQPDVLYPYRQDSNFYYLTGFKSPSSLFVLTSSKSVLFIQDKNAVQEIWNGKRETISEVKKTFAIGHVHYLSDLNTKLPLLLKRKSQIFYNQSQPYFNKILKPYQKKILSAEKFLAPFRAIKDKQEVSHLKQACLVTAYAHKQVAKHLKPNINERSLHGIFLKSLMEKGSPREGYGSIIACGNNAVTLHYIKNNSICKAGETLLVDAGAEMNYYTADITRVYPVNGVFKKNQKSVYNQLLTLQKNLIKMTKPGVFIKDINTKMLEGIALILKDILNRSTSQHLARKYCPHSVGHLLGLDVHDPLLTDHKNLALKSGMVLTIEPGIYFSKKDKFVPKDLRGSGFRIEDNILITSKGYEVLSQSIPKEIKDIEKLCSGI